MSEPIAHGLTPDSQAWQALERRVAALEGQASHGDLPGSVGGILQRLDRHRGELEEIKRRYNDLARYVRGITNRRTDDDDTGGDRAAGSEAPRRADTD